MITTGSVLRLHGKGLYVVTQFRFEIAESGSWEATVGLLDLETKLVTFHLVSMVLTLLKDAEVYPPVSEKFMAELHELRTEKDKK